MPNRKRSRIVIVLGAGFSAGLGFPLTGDLLWLVFGNAETKHKDLIAKVIRFHFPSFEKSDVESYPNIEELLTRIAVNEELWSASRPLAGGFKKSDLLKVRNELLHQISQLLHERLERISNTAWLDSFIQYAKRVRATVISFNWDLVLEKYLFDGDINHHMYGLGQRSQTHPILLKPHGSLNWFAASGIETVKQDRVTSLTADFCLPPDHEEIMQFQRLRSPTTRHDRQYVPYIVPPTFLKRFDHPLLRKIWLTAIQDIGQASKVIFIGYSFPKYDYHSDFMFRCGFNNQLQGNLSRDGNRLNRTGPSKIVVVNRDTEGTLRARMEELFGFSLRETKHQVHFVRRTAATWIRNGGLKA